MRLRALPDSLFGRLFVAIIAVVALTLVTMLVLIIRERRELLDSGAGASVSAIVATAEHLAQLPADERHAALEELRAHRRTVDAMRRARLEDRRETRAEIERRVIHKLQRRLGDRYQVREARADMPHRDIVALGDERDAAARAPTSGPTPGFDRRPFEIEIELPDGERVAFRMPAPRLGPPLPSEIFLNFGILTLVLGLVLYGMTRTITRPLGKLAGAADAIGRGERVAPLPEEGGRELRAATRAFNSMQERLHRYLDSRTRVLAAMSHDLRTPLTRLRLRVESIEDEQLRNRCTADLDEMGNMIRGALGLFRGLNDEEPAVPVDVNALLAAVRAEHIELGDAVTLTGHAQAAVIAKPLALKRCLGNLIQNAIQYGSEANIHVEDGDALTIRIRDRGPGIPPEALEQVFEPFFRIESSRSRDTGGTGLGLSIARDIAQAHGGRLELQNLEQGLEARLILPRQVAS